MIVKLHTESLSETRWYEYAVRFVLGGAITVAAGLIAKKYGAAVGGLFLAFPAIFPASATLIEKHERQRKEELGLNGTCRAREAAGADAFGATMATVALMAFALVAWELLPDHNAVLAIAAATVAWAAVSSLLWLAWKKNVLHALRGNGHRRAHLATETEPAHRR